MTKIFLKLGATNADKDNLFCLVAEKIIDLKRKNPQIPIEAIADYIGESIEDMSFDFQDLEDYSKRLAESREYSIDRDSEIVRLSEDGQPFTGKDWEALELDTWAILAGC